MFICIRACDLKGIKNNTNQVLSRIMIIDQEAFQVVGYCNFVILLVCSGAHFEREISMLSTKILEPKSEFILHCKMEGFLPRSSPWNSILETPKRGICGEVMGEGRSQF